MTTDKQTKAKTKKVAGGKWVKDSIGVLYVVEGQVQFADDFEHLANGFCRLLEVPEEKVAALIEEWVQYCLEMHGQLPSQLSAEIKISALTAAVQKVFTIAGPRFEDLSQRTSWGTDFFGNQADTIYAGSISGNITRAVVGCKKSGFAWLIEPESQKAVHAGSIEYDTAYFNDRPDSHYGMKQYLQHTDWRMQKARRFAAHMLDVSGERAKKWLKNPADVSLLDIGSATGLFRAAVGELGFEHCGIDLSADAIELCRQNFGFATWEGSIFDLEKHIKNGQKFNIITLWDVIEHLDRHIEALQSIANYLTDDGIIVVRSPNLESMEATILGDMYYSFKLDHTSYFSVRSLDKLFSQIDMKSIHTETVSHIFKGCLGVQYLYDAGERMEGADILAVYARDDASAKRRGLSQ